MSVLNEPGESESLKEILRENDEQRRRFDKERMKRSQQPPEAPATSTWLSHTQLGTKSQRSEHLRHMAKEEDKQDITIGTTEDRAKVQPAANEKEFGDIAVGILRRWPTWEEECKKPSRIRLIADALGEIYRRGLYVGRGDTCGALQPPEEAKLSLDAMEAAREYVEDACAHYPHGDGPLITFSNEERIRVLASLLTRREAPLREDLRYQTEARLRDAKDNAANFQAWKKEHHDPLRERLAELEGALQRVSWDERLQSSGQDDPLLCQIRATLATKPAGEKERK